MRWLPAAMVENRSRFSKSVERVAKIRGGLLVDGHFVQLELSQPNLRPRSEVRGSVTSSTARGGPQPVQRLDKPVHEFSDLAGEARRIQQSFDKPAGQARRTSTEVSSQYQLRKFVRGRTQLTGGDYKMHLGYLVQLSSEFRFPVQMQSMLYPRCS